MSTLRSGFAFGKAKVGLPSAIGFTDRLGYIHAAIVAKAATFIRPTAECG